MAKTEREHPVEISSTYVESGGRRIGVSFLRDITERMEAEEELEDSRQMLRTVLDTVPMHVFWRDKELRYLGCNTAGALSARLPDPDAIVGLTEHDLPWAGQGRGAAERRPRGDADREHRS